LKSRDRVVGLCLLAVTRLLVHVISFPAMGELFGFRFGQHETESSRAQSVVIVNVGRQTKIIGVQEMIFDRLIVLRNDVVARIVYDIFSSSIGRGDVPLFGLIEESHKQIPVSLVGTVRGGLVDLKLSEDVNLARRSFATIPKQYFNAEWFAGVVRIVLNDIEVRNAEPCSLVQLGGCLGVVGCTVQLGGCVGSFLPDFVGARRKTFSSLGVLISSMGFSATSRDDSTGGERLDIGGFDQLISLPTGRLHDPLLLVVDSCLHSANSCCNENQKDSDFLCHVRRSDSLLSLAMNVPNSDKKARFYVGIGFALWIGGLYGVWRSVYRENWVGAVCFLSFAIVGIEIAIRH